MWRSNRQHTVAGRAVVGVTVHRPNDATVFKHIVPENVSKEYPIVPPFSSAETLCNGLDVLCSVVLLQKMAFGREEGMALSKGTRYTAKVSVGIEKVCKMVTAVLSIYQVQTWWRKAVSRAVRQICSHSEGARVQYTPNRRLEAKKSFCWKANSSKK